MMNMNCVLLKVEEALNKMAVYPEVQRKISPARVKALVGYIDEGIAGSRNLFLPMIIVNERANGTWSVNDGQHRFVALQSVLEKYTKEMEKAAKVASSARTSELDRIEAVAKQAELSAKRATLLDLDIGIQVFMGLSEEEERQLFADVNVNVNKPPMSLGASFDTSSLTARVLGETLKNLPNLDAETERSSVKLTDKLVLFTTLRKGIEILLGKNLQEDDFDMYVERVTKMYDIYMKSLPADAKSEAYFYTYASNLFAVARYTRDLIELADQGVSWERTLESTLHRTKMEHANPLFQTLGGVPVDPGTGKLVFTGTGSAIPSILNVLRAYTTFVDANGKSKIATFKRNLKSTSLDEEIVNAPDDDFTDPLAEPHAPLHSGENHVVASPDDSSQTEKDPTEANGER